MYRRASALLLLCLASGATPTMLAAETKAETGSQPVAKTPAKAVFPAFGAIVPEFKPAFVIRGPVPRTFDDGALHLIGLFSTRMTSSLKSIPYLNDFYNTYGKRGVRVTGVSVWEESESAVKDFLTARGTSLAFPVAFDGRDAGGTISTLWQLNADLNIVPYLFAVRNNTVLWHGTPDELSAGTLESMITGTYDLAQEMARREAIAIARANAAPLTEIIEDLLAQNKPDEALPKCDELEKLLPECDRILATQLRAECHFTKGDYQAGFAATARFLAAYPNDAQLHATVALEIVAEPRFKQRDFALAKKCINRALEITPVEPYRLLKARVYYTAGDLAVADEILRQLAAPQNAAVASHMKLIRDAVAARQPWPIPPNLDCACGAH